MPEFLSIAVSGASGQLGRMIIAELLERVDDPSQIIAISRSPKKLADLAACGVETRAGDFDKPGPELEAAFAGAARALIISTTPEAPYVKGKRFRQQKAGIDAAHRAGVPHIYYTSAPSPEPPTPAIWKEDHYLTECYLRELDGEWTILRHGEWPDWHLEENWIPAIERGRYATAAGEGRIAHITREDTAAADAGALLADDAAGQIYEMTGPAALNADEVFAIIHDITGKRVNVAHVDSAALAGELESNDVEPLFIPIFQMIAEAIRLGKYEHVTKDAEMLSGRPLTTMRKFLEDRLDGLKL